MYLIPPTLVEKNNVVRFAPVVQCAKLYKLHMTAVVKQPF